MKYSTKSITLGLLVGVLAVLAPIAAYSQGLPLRGPLPFTAYDRDENGQVSEEEFATLRRERMEARMARMRARCDASSARMFSWLDTDHDGQLSREELDSAQGTPMGRPGWGGMGYGPGMGRGMGMMRNRPAFPEFDLNDDGAIAEDEFNTARNNRIKERTEQGYRMRNMPYAPTFADLDADGNGQISAEEFAAHQRMMPWRRMP